MTFPAARVRTMSRLWCGARKPISTAPGFSPSASWPGSPAKAPASRHLEHHVGALPGRGGVVGQAGAGRLVLGVVEEGRLSRAALDGDLEAELHHPAHGFRSGGDAGLPRAALAGDEDLHHGQGLRAIGFRGNPPISCASANPIPFLLDLQLPGRRRSLEVRPRRSPAGSWRISSSRRPRAAPGAGARRRRPPPGCPARCRGRPRWGSRASGDASILPPTNTSTRPRP